MRKLILTAVTLGLLATPAAADTMKNCGAGWKAMPAADQAKTTYKSYSAMCLKKDYKVGVTPAAAMSGPSMSGPMTPQQRMKDCAAKWSAMSAADKAKTTYKAYSAVCLKKS
jgi:hypothetical protein